MSLKPLFSRFKQDESGQYAIMTAVLAMPVLLATSSALDMGNASGEKNRVKNALDNAVLAAATNNKINDTEKQALAKLHFERNYHGRATVTTTASASGGIVRMTADGSVPVSLASAIGLKGINIKAKSAAARSEKNVICVLALSDSDDAAIEFSGDVEFFSPTCSVHANSTSNKAIVSDSSETPVAMSFCATGGVEGSFSPYAKGECQAVSDPYLNVPSPLVTPCVSSLGSSNGNGNGNGNNSKGVTVNADTVEEAGSGIVDSENESGSNVTLRPGTYCGGLTVDGQNVDFLPGDYIIMDGPLTFKNSAEATAEDVTFAFTGSKSQLKIEKGANLTVKAPSTGPRQGLAFMEMAENYDKKGKLKETKEGGKNRKNANLIASGGNLNVIGTVYFPTQSLVVQGEGTTLGTQAPATSFIAWTVDLEGGRGSVVTVKVDHVAADIPPLLPRAEDGAVLME